MTTSKSVNAYGNERALRYDQYSAVTMGDRRLQRDYLRGLLKNQQFSHNSFLDLGCGTGFFGEVFFEHLPEISGHLADGSAAMLELAKQRVSKESRKVAFQHCLFDAFDWSVEQAFDVVFSAYAIHHIPDADKWALFAQIYSRLGSGGAFILFDNFLPREAKGREVIEYLTCMEIARRARNVASIEQVIATDREVKAAEGDQEATFEDHLSQLRAIGFAEVVPVFLDARYGGIVAYKA